MDAGPLAGLLDVHRPRLERLFVILSGDDAPRDVLEHVLHALARLRGREEQLRIALERWWGHVRIRRGAAYLWGGRGCRCALTADEETGGDGWGGRHGRVRGYATGRAE